MNFSKQSSLVLAILLCAALGIMANVSRGKSSSGLEETTTQDLGSLDRRISLLEQRFYSVESSISRLQQLIISQRPPASQPSTSDRELSLMREEIQRLSLRLNEVECGLVKLDERTTTSARDSRKSGGAAKSTDPCRLNPDAPLRLSTRP
jgi:predicted RNase H-like nuclease (RuvC/YqgF family)